MRIDPKKPVSAPKSAPTFSLPKHGQWSVNAKGEKSDPINMYIHGSFDDVKQTFVDAGWIVPASKTVPHMLEYGAAAVAHEIARHTGLPDPAKGVVARMPIAHAFFDGKPDVMSFEMHNDPTGGRHHFRVFDTGSKDAAGKPVWAVAASLDVKTVFAPDRPEQMFINHIIDKNADKERDFVMASLRDIDAVSSEKSVRLPFGDPAPTGLHSVDGRVFDVVLD